MEKMFRRIFKIISHLSAKSDQENERERMSGSAMAVQRVSERARGRREGGEIEREGNSKWAINL